MSCLFWRIHITGYTCDIHGVPVVWRRSLQTSPPEWISQSVIGLIYKDFTIYPESPEWSTLMSAAVPYAHDFNLAEDLPDWMAGQCRSHL